MFGRKPAAPEVEPVSDAKADGKGRPTPTRKEAEAARKASLKVPSDPKEARKAMRERQRSERQAARVALASGDEKALGPRDAGPTRLFIRNTIDRRRSVGEVFIPVAILVLLSGFLQQPLIVQITYWAWLVMLALVVLDVIWISFRLRRTAAVELPDVKLTFSDYLYGIMRSLTLRKLRLPPPKFKAGGKPVPPKAPKGS